MKIENNQNITPEEELKKPNSFLTELDIGKELARQGRVLSFFPDFVKDPNLEKLSKEHIIKKEEKIVLTADLKESSKILNDDVATEVFVKNFNQMIAQIEEILENNNGQILQYTGDGLILELSIKEQENQNESQLNLQKIHKILNSNPNYQFRTGADFGESNKMITKNIAYFSFGNAISESQKLEKNASIDSINIGQNLETKLKNFSSTEKIIFNNQKEKQSQQVDQFNNLESFIPSEVVERENKEHRLISTAFINIKDAFQNQEKLTTTIDEIKKLCDRYSGLLKINNYDNGLQLMIYSGLSDNSKVSSIIRLSDEIKQNLEKNNFNFNIGISSGKAFIQEIGNDFKEILATGQKVVEAARLAQSKHEKTIILDEELKNWLLANQAAKLKPTKIKVKSYERQAHVLEKLYSEQYDENILFGQNYLLEKLKNALEEENNSIIRINGIKGTGNDHLASILKQNQELEDEENAKNDESFIQIELNPWAKDFKFNLIKQIFTKLNLQNEIDWDLDSDLLIEIIKDNLKQQSRELIISIIDAQRLDNASAQIIQEIANDSSLNIKFITATHQEKNNLFQLKENCSLETQPLKTKDEVIAFIVNQTNFDQEEFLNQINQDNKSTLAKKIENLEYLTQENLLENIKFASLYYDPNINLNQWLHEVVKNLDNLDNLNQVRFSSLGENSKTQKFIDIASCLTMGDNGKFNNQTVIDIAKEINLEFTDGNFQTLIDNHFLSKQDFNEEFSKRNNRLSSSMADYRYRHLSNDDKIKYHKLYLNYVNKKEDKKIHDYSATNAHLIQKLKLTEAENKNQKDQNKLLETVVETFDEIDKNCDQILEFKEFALASKAYQSLIEIKKEYESKINQNKIDSESWKILSLRNLYFSKGQFDYKNGDYQEAVQAFEERLKISDHNNIEDLIKNINGLVIVSEGIKLKEEKGKYLKNLESLIPQLEKKYQESKNLDSDISLLSQLSKYTSTAIGNQIKLGVDPIELESINEKNIKFVESFYEKVNLIKNSQILNKKEKEEKLNKVQRMENQLFIQQNNIASYLIKLSNKFEKENPKKSKGLLLKAKNLIIEVLEKIKTEYNNSHYSKHWLKANLSVIYKKMDQSKENYQKEIVEALELAVEKKDMQAIKEFISDNQKYQIIDLEKLPKNITDFKYFQIATKIITPS